MEPLRQNSGDPSASSAVPAAAGERAAREKLERIEEPQSQMEEMIIEIQGPREQLKTASLTLLARAVFQGMLGCRYFRDAFSFKPV